MKKVKGLNKCPKCYGIGKFFSIDEEDFPHDDNLITCTVCDGSGRVENK